MTVRPLPLLALVLLGCACADVPTSEAGGSSVEVVDSAGVRIVAGTPETWPLAEAWTLSPEPILQIGEIEGEPEYNLDGVVGVTRDATGRVVVLERAARLRWYDASGQHLRTREFRGQGPGEVQSASRLLPFRGDSLYVLSPGGGGPAVPGSRAFPGRALPDRMGWGAFVVFDSEGEFGRQGVVWSEGFPGPFDGSHVVFGNVDIAVAALADGSVLNQANPTARIEGNVGARLDVLYPLTRSTSLGAQVPDTISFARWSQVDVPVGGSDLSTGNQRIAYQSVLFDPGYVPPATFDDRVYLADAETGWISVFRADEAGSELVESWRPEVPARATGDALLDEYLDVHAAVFASSPEDAADTRARFTQLGRADSLPVVEQIRMDAVGNLWMAEGRVFSGFIGTVRERGVWTSAEDGPTRWTVFSPDGVPVGTVLTPAGLRVDEIGEDYLLGTTWDELGVPRIRMYALDRASN